MVPSYLAYCNQSSSNPPSFLEATTSFFGSFVKDTADWVLTLKGFESLIFKPLSFAGTLGSESSAAIQAAVDIAKIGERIKAFFPKKERALGWRKLQSGYTHLTYQPTYPFERFILTARTISNVAGLFFHGLVISASWNKLNKVPFAFGKFLTGGRLIFTAYGLFDEGCRLYAKVTTLKKASSSKMEVLASMIKIAAFAADLFVILLVMYHPSFRLAQTFLKGGKIALTIGHHYWTNLAIKPYVDLVEKSRHYTKES